MKKLFTILTVVAISTTMTFAQQGSVALGVGSDVGDIEWTMYSLSPTVGYFISDNILVGTGFSMRSGDGHSNEGMSISPYARYYITSSLYAMAGLDMEMPKEGDGTTGIDAGIGATLMWNDKVAIEPGFGLSIGDETMDIGFSLGISVRLEMEE
jgi:hypothetical protein